MQLFKVSPMLLCALGAMLLPCGGGHKVFLGHSGRKKKSSSASAWAAYFTANNEGYDYWSAAWSGVRSQLARLAVVDGLKLQKNTTSDAAVAAALPKFLKVSPIVELATLRNSIEYSNQHVEGLDVEEQKSKKKFAEQDALHKDRLAAIEARYLNKTLLKEFRDSQTTEESRQFGGWQRLRANQQRQLNSSLKIQHGAAEQAQQLIDAFQTGSSSSKSELVQKAQLSMARFVHLAWAEIQKEQSTLDAAYHA